MLFFYQSIKTLLVELIEKKIEGITDEKLRKTILTKMKSVVQTQNGGNQKCGDSAKMLKQIPSLLRKRPRQADLNTTLQVKDMFGQIHMDRIINKLKDQAFKTAKNVKVVKTNFKDF